MFFSIIIPTYNRANLITETINSLLNQTQQNFELIVIDDGSTDNTEAAVKQINSDKISYYKIPNSRQGAARNFGVKKAQGDYVNFFDSDDIAYNNHLEKANEVIEKYAYPNLLVLNFATKDLLTGKTIDNVFKQNTCNDILWKGNILHCNGIFIKKEIALLNPFNESKKFYVAEDWDLWLKLAARYPIYTIPTVTSCLINHNGRSVLNSNALQLIDSKNALIESLSFDEIFMKKYGNKISSIEAHMDSYIALHSVLGKDRMRGVYYLWQAILLNPKEFFTRRTLAIIKHLLF